MNHTERQPFKLVTVSSEQEAILEQEKYLLFTDILEIARTSNLPSFIKIIIQSKLGHTLFTRYELV